MDELRGLLMRYWSSIASAAVACGIDVHRLYRIVHRDTEMAISDVISIAEATGVPANDVITVARAVNKTRAGPQKEKSSPRCANTRGSRQ